MILASSQMSYAQLLTDRNKLKTAKRESGFLQFKKKSKVKKPSGKHKTIAARKTRSTTPATKAGGKQKVNPKFSVTTAGQARNRKISPRYSQNNAGQVKGKKVSPRFSQNNAGQVKGKKVNPRYTQSNAGQSDNKKIVPRFSIINAGQVDGKKIAPRFSPPSTSHLKGKKISPRYTQSHAGQSGVKKISPRFSVMTAGQVKSKKINPRFTQTNAGQVKGKAINPRYSEWKQAGKVVIVKPRFTTPPTYSRTKPAGNREKGFLPGFNLYRKPAKHKPGPGSQYAGATKEKVQKPNHAGEHNKNIKSYKKYKNKSMMFSPNSQVSNFELKTKKMRKKRDMHPSANYLSAKYYKSRTVRNTKRKFNVMWVRMYGNKTQPDAVKKKTKKAKFDKDEIEIWNN
ncbi:hypothetical protein N7E81_01435 [Reichenbachiella carrageenanivorans]|uniref:Uncharacterized protein n=1 Tax=Reichenbachiella carrageenanivorans TaxID=2979869 RepID=A0ABY6D0S0_9BACT|nr:hypothetical protein [Reichenbachiella carrageenanivorans]UXX79771.1 hypothetical protein N7E81_01435 [Reichenbachiella carrageenanivorans]